MFKNGKKIQVLVDAYSIPISRKDLETLRGLNWLNDEIINFYMQVWNTFRFLFL
jgi:sentrin-specific protease 1